MGQVVFNGLMQILIWLSVEPGASLQKARAHEASLFPFRTSGSPKVVQEKVQCGPTMAAQQPQKKPLVLHKLGGAES